VRKVNLLALGVGWVVDIGGSNAIALLYILWATATGRLDLAIVSDQNALMRDPELVQALFVTGLAVSVVAGYVAARIAGRAHVLYGLLSSAAAVVFGILSLGQALQAQPQWLVAAGFVAGPAAGALGGYIALQQAQRSVATSESTL
jgi:hypothetical protein